MPIFVPILFIYYEDFLQISKMGGLPLPKFKTCCCCSLKVACVIIVIWSMWAAAHSTSILFHPVCKNIYTKEGGEHYRDLTRIMWILLSFNIMTLFSSFAFLLGIFMSHKGAADMFMCCGLLTATLMLFHALFTALQMSDSNCKNSSDAVAHVIYFFLWIYSILAVNSYRDKM